MQIGDIREALVREGPQGDESWGGVSAEVRGSEKLTFKQTT